MIQALKIAKDHQANITFVSVLSKFEGWRKLFKPEGQASKNIDNYSSDKVTALKTWLTKHELGENIEVRIYKGIGFIETIKDVVKRQL